MRPLRLPPDGTEDKRKVATAVNQIIARLWPSGTTAERPSDPPTGYTYWDTTLGKLIGWNGSAWVNVNGSAL